MVSGHRGSGDANAIKGGGAVAAACSAPGAIHGGLIGGPYAIGGVAA